MIYIANSFSLSMLPSAAGDGSEIVVRVRRITDPSAWLVACEVDAQEQAVSAVGHADTARLFSVLLKRYVPTNRIAISLTPEDGVLVGQISGGRLPEGCTTLPDGVSVTWLLVSLDTGWDTA